MCGRMNVFDAPITRYLLGELGLEFHTPTNTDLRPTQRVDTLMLGADSGLHQVETRWGIQPQWAKRILINAQAESAHEKRTFKTAFAQSRCLVPVTGWYEWRKESSAKTKYLFTQQNEQPLFMGGLVFQGEQHPELVTFTIAPNEKCAAYHHRMPLFVLPEQIDYWFNSSVQELQPLLAPVDSELIKVQAV